MGKCRQSVDSYCIRFTEIIHIDEGSIHLDLLKGLRSKITPPSVSVIHFQMEDSY